MPFSEACTLETGFHSEKYTKTWSSCHFTNESASRMRLYSILSSSLLPFCVVDSGRSSSGGDTGCSDEEDQEMGDVSKMQDMDLGMGTGLSQEAISKAKQCKSERKARKVMLKLGLRHIEGKKLELLFL